MMISYTIQITVDPPGAAPSGGSTGNFVYAPALLRVERDDTVTWTCASPFAVSFKERTPIDHVEVFGHETRGGFSAGPFIIHGERGRYHYAVAVWNGTRVFIDAACPQISVN